MPDTPPMTTPPNILFILTDQHNAKVTGYNGHSHVRTPHLDRLAAAGVVCANAIAQNPICTPSRMSWLSGQYCHNHGYYGLSGPQLQGLPTILGHFRAHGYTTSAIGKIHCPAYWVEHASDVFHETCFTSIGGRSPAYAAYLEERGLTQLEDHRAFPECGARGVGANDSRPSRISFDDSQEGWIARATITFMQNATCAGQPFFAYASLPKPHSCYAPAQEFWDLYDERSLCLPPNTDYDMRLKAPHFRRSVEYWRTDKDWLLFEPRTFAAARLRKYHGYLGCISHSDHAVGQLLAYLDQAGLTDNTIVVYSSDHGEYACEHGIMEKAPGICADAVTRVPMVWRWPGHVPAGQRCNDVVETVDFTTTICAMAGVAPLETSDGHDLTPQLCGASGDPARLGVTEFPWSRSVRKGRWRLVVYAREMFPDEYPDGFGELYDVDTDPWEMHNLYFEPTHADTVTQLQRDLLLWLMATTRPVTAHDVTPDPAHPVTTAYHQSLGRDGKQNPAWFHTRNNGNYL